MATALILGASGFVGPWLAKELQAHGYRVYASDVQPGPAPRLACDAYVRADLLDPTSLSALFEGTRPDQVYNLAAVSSVGQSWRNPALTMRVNVEGAVNLLEACRKMDPMPKVLLVGSSEEYAPSEVPLTEESPIAATNPYGISKEAQGLIADMYVREYGLAIYRVRAFNHTGPGQAPSFVLPSWCKQVAEIEKSGMPGTMRVGNLDVARDFADVRDVVRAYRMLVESDYRGEVFNIGTGRPIKLREMAEYIASLCSQKVSIEVDHGLLRPSDNKMICCDSTKANKFLSWEPKYTIEDALARMFDSFLNE